MPFSSNAGIVIEIDCRRRETGIVLLDCNNMWEKKKRRESERDRVGRIEREKKEWERKSAKEREKMRESERESESERERVKGRERKRETESE